MFFEVLTLLILISIHFFAANAERLGWLWHGRFLSFAAGISFAYVFVDLLPTLEKEQPILKSTFGETIPYLDRHAYVMALFGVLVYYGLQPGMQPGQKTTKAFWLMIFGYGLFNFLVGASLADRNNPDIQPLFLFTLAMGMHYFIHDHNLNMDFENSYSHIVRWLLVLALILGFTIGFITEIPSVIEALGVSFLAGGMILNALRYELPKRNQLGYAFFVIGALSYTALILGLRS